MILRSPHIACLLFLLIFPSIIFAQNSESEPLFFQTYTIEDGLSDNWIRDITQDQQGYLWIATASGISRFDGYEFKIFRNDPADSTSLSGNDAYAIHTDRSNNVWVATVAGIDRFDRSSLTFRRYQVDMSAYSTLSFDSNLFYKFYESDNGSLYIGTDNGLAIFDDAQQEFRMIRADTEKDLTLSHPEVTSITESADGRLWIGTYGGGINILNPETGNMTYLRHDPDDVSSLPNDDILNLFIDREQVLWVNYDRRENRLRLYSENAPSGSASGLWKKELNTGSVQHYLYNPESGHPLWANISDFEQTRDGKVWISQRLGFEGGLQLYDDETDTFFVYLYDVTDPGSLPWDFATSLLEDRSGHLWVGTSRGLARADRSQIQMNAFTPVPADRYSRSNNFYGIEEVGVNHFLISDPGISITAWNRDTNTWKQIKDLASIRLPVVYDSRSHAWLLSSENTIERVHLETYEKQIFNLHDSTAGSIAINHFLRLSDDLLLVATREGLWKLTPSSGEFTKIDLSFRTPAAEEPDIVYLADDTTGTVWLGINDASLDVSHSRKGILVAQYDPTNGKTVYPEINDSYLSALGNGIANHLMTDSRGLVWISKSNGLVLFEPEANRSTFYNEQDGLQHLNVFGTLEDNLGMIWISTEYGISRLNPNTGSIKNFDRDDGLRPSRMNAHSFYKRENGELMFGGVGGLSYFHPVDIRESDEPPFISLVRLEAGETTVPLSGTGAGEVQVEIDWGSNSISVEFVSVNFRNPEQTTYSYKLEGFHTDWVVAGTRRFTQFSNLPPRNYTFHVRAVNADGIISTEAASVSFAVLPPWWRTWWAYGFYLMLLIAGIVAVDRIQRRRVQQKEREKAREKELEQAKEIEKAYKNLEVAHEDLKAAKDQLVQQEKLASLGQLTAGIAHEIKNPLNFVNNFSDLSIELVEEVREELSALSRQLAEGTENSPFEGGAEVPDGTEVGDDTGTNHDLILDILDDIEMNLRKIYEHGTRADGIVKSMLQHSRGGSGKMEPTDVNALIKEYANLAFHGMRAGKDPINVDIELDLDENVGEVEMIAEDFSRVILNLCNNAFDAMREKALTPTPLPGGEGRRGEGEYSPKLTVRTHRNDQTVIIEIQDNGPGIPDEIKDKILQPFFTTKKGTSGTGLGLSITNDIIKAHGGTMEIQTDQEGSTFSIKLKS